jgi:hypothetical protein
MPARRPRGDDDFYHRFGQRPNGHLKPGSSRSVTPLDDPVLLTCASTVAPEPDAKSQHRLYEAANHGPRMNVKVIRPHHRRYHRHSSSRAGSRR